MPGVHTSLFDCARREPLPSGAMYSSCAIDYSFRPRVYPRVLFCSPEPTGLASKAAQVRSPASRTGRVPGGHAKTIPAASEACLCSSLLPAIYLGCRRTSRCGAGARALPRSRGPPIAYARAPVAQLVADAGSSSCAPGDPRGVRGLARVGHRAGRAHLLCPGPLRVEPVVAGVDFVNVKGARRDGVQGVRGHVRRGGVGRLPQEERGRELRRGGDRPRGKPRLQVHGLRDGVDGRAGRGGGCPRLESEGRGDGPRAV